ncbi:hypothetical protein [Bartonella jaculi]|uniref:hypothetical protein n=1 Tax=Bartonella jaculi TaxID=686226 RepID=UPI0031EC464F
MVGVCLKAAFADLMPMGLGSWLESSNRGVVAGEFRLWDTHARRLLSGCFF